jgi:vacuolar protein sorting-associated protein 45
MEVFVDFLVINRDLVTLDIGYPGQRTWGINPDVWNADSLQRTTEGLISLLLTLKRKPLIRYAKNSLLAKKLATEIRYQITQEEKLFEFLKPDTPPILLILDRRDDPVTPLLTQWTYQAMVHELLGIRNGRVDLSDVPDVRPELKVPRFVEHVFASNSHIYRRLYFLKTKIPSSSQTCISTLATLVKMRKNTSRNSHQRPRAVIS